jgi:precorrin-6B methylase 2/predicted transcriptional regulator
VARDGRSAGGRRATVSEVASPVVSVRDRAFELVAGFRIAQLLRAAVELRIPDLLQAGPASVERLAETTGIDAMRLRRALRALSSLGLLKEDEQGRFTSTELGNLFSESTPGSVGPMLLMQLDGYRAWGHFLESLRTGRTGQSIEYGENHWQTLAGNPEEAARFNAAMVAQTEQAIAFVAANLDLDQNSVVVDVGGGNGALVAGLLRARPDLRGIVCDLAPGLAGTADYLARTEVADRCRVLEADFFDSLPAEGDAYFLKQVLHDWDDEHAARILATCRRSMRAGARIVIIERLQPGRMVRDPNHLGLAMLDLEMMVRLGGRERTLQEYVELLEGAGFHFLRALPGERFALIEAQPA